MRTNHIRWMEAVEEAQFLYPTTLSLMCPVPTCRIGEEETFPLPFLRTLTAGSMPANRRPSGDGASSPLADSNIDARAVVYEVRWESLRSGILSSVPISQPTFKLCGSLGCRDLEEEFDPIWGTLSRMFSQPVPRPNLGSLPAYWRSSAA
jgi:hypothetical protein